MPSMPGSTMSISTASKSPCAIRSAAASPRPMNSALWPSSVRIVLSTTRPNGLSSTPRMRSAGAGAAGTAAFAPEPAAFEALARLKLTVSVKVVPPPRRCATTMSPPIARAICFTDDSPSPAPPKREAIVTLACENGRNRRLISLSVSPIPLSETEKATPTLPLHAAHRDHLERDAALFGELHRIVDQVFQRGAQPHGIADHQRRKLFRNIDTGLQAFCRRPAGQRIAGAARQRPQVEEILPHAGHGVTASGGVDEQGRKARQMFGAGLDGIDPAPLALVEIRRRQQIADGENPGERGADLVGERGERRLDHARFGRLLGNALARLAGGKAGSALFRRPLFRRPRGAP